jgi:hypothetical protein
MYQDVPGRQWDARLPEEYMSVNEKKWVIPRIRFAGETLNISAGEALNAGAEKSFAQKSCMITSANL